MIARTTLTVDEVTDSLTGFEEIAVEQKFGLDPNALLNEKPIRGMRALATVLVARDLRKNDVKDPDGKAYKHVMGMTLKQVGDFFPDADAEPVPDEPVSESGKDVAQPA